MYISVSRSYGRKIKPIFNPKIHESSRMVEIDGESRCDGVFELLIKSGTSVPIGKTVSPYEHGVTLVVTTSGRCPKSTAPFKTATVGSLGIIKRMSGNAFPI
jgi:hypothetical protein